MITLQFGVYSSDIVRDVRSDAISIFNVLEDFDVHQFPYIISQIAGAFFLRREIDDPDPYHVTIRGFYRGEEQFKHDISGNFKGKSRVRLFVRLGEVQVSVPGVLKLVLSEGDRPLLEWSVKIDLIEVPVKEAAA